MKVGIFGDWHGNKKYAIEQLRSSNENADTYLHVGDFGVWPETYLTTSYGNYVNSLEKILAKQEKELWFIDGNHEDFRILERLEKDERGLGKLSEHIFHIPRGYTWEWEGVRFLGLGGAISVDKDYRVPNKSWFAQEEITKEDVEKAKRAGKVDVMISHDAPFLPVPFRSFGEEIDKAGAKSILSVGEVMAEVEPELFVHGHYHTAYSREFLGSTVIGLSKDATSLADNSLFIDLDDFRSSR